MPDDLRENLRKKIKTDLGLDKNVQFFMLEGKAFDTEFSKMYESTALVGIIDIALGGTKDKFNDFISKVERSNNIQNDRIPEIMMTALRYIIDNQEFLLDEKFIANILRKEELMGFFGAYPNLKSVIDLNEKGMAREQELNNGTRPRSPNSVTSSDRPRFIAEINPPSFEDYAVYQTMYDMLNTKTKDSNPNFVSFYLARAVANGKINQSKAYNIFSRARKELMIILSGELRSFPINFDSTASYSSNDNMPLFMRRSFLDYVKKNFSSEIDEEDFSTSDNEIPRFSLMPLTKIADFMNCSDVTSLIQDNKDFQLHELALEASNLARDLNYMYNDKSISQELQKTEMGKAWASYALASNNGASEFIVAPPDCDFVGARGKSAKELLKEEGNILREVIDYLEASDIDGDVKSNLLPLVDYNTCWVFLSNFYSGMKRSPLEKLNDLIHECNSSNYGNDQIKENFKVKLKSFHDQMVSSRVRNFMLSKPKEFLQKILGENNELGSSNEQRPSL